MKTRNLFFMTLLLTGMSLTIQAQTDNPEVIKRQNDSLKKAIDTLQKRISSLKLDDKDYYSRKYSEVLIDFSKKTPSIALPKKIKEGDFYVVKIQNFNPNRYSVEIKNKDTILSKPLELPTFADFSLDNLSALTSGFNKNIIVDTTALSFKTLTIDTIKESLKLAKKNNAEFKEQFESLKTKWDDLKFRVYKLRLNLLKTIPDTSDKSFDYNEALAKTEELRVSAKELKVEVKASQTAFLAIVDDPQAITLLNATANADVKKEVEGMKVVYSSFASKLDEFGDLLSADNLEKLLKTILFLSTENSYTSLPIQFKGEREELSISFTPKDTSSGLQKETLAPLVFPLKDQWYWAVGTSFYYSNLDNDRYAVTTSNSNESTFYSFNSLERTKGEAGIAATLRVGYKFGLVGAHLSVGPGISIEKTVRPRLLFGGGFSLGKRHNLTIDCGGILGYVDRIPEGVSTTGYSSVPNPLTTDTMVGFYFGVGYMYKL